MSDDTKKKKDKKDIGQTLIGVAEGLKTLKVRTCVGKIHAKNPKTGAGMTDFELDWDPKETKVLSTEINLLAGDANNFLHEDFQAKDDDAWMRQFHERQVARAQDVVTRNVDTMMKLGKVLVSDLKELFE